LEEDSMATQEIKRKLTAILSADVKGYSRLMGEDEVETLKTLSAYFQIMTDLIQKHRGKVVNIAGDNLLADFESVVDAVECAVEIQQELKVRNAELSENRRMEFRIGINLGDVIEEGEKIFGDGVNIAARLENMSEAGGICISGTAYDQVKNKLPLGYQFLGEQTVKNIAEPVRVYRVLMEPEAAGKVLGEKKTKPRPWSRATIAGVVILIFIVAAVVVWKVSSHPPKLEVASKEKMAFPLPDTPSIAVLPFVNMSGDPKQEFFSDGITEEIITALSKTPKLLVIARNSTFTYKGKALKVKQVAEELGVRYVLEGSVRTAGEQLRITAQLIDATTGNHLWAERYDRELKDLFTIQDNVTMRILTSLQVKLTKGEEARMWARGTNNLDAYLKVLEAAENVLRMNKESNVLARQLAKEAIDLDPQYPFAYTILGATHMFDVWLGISSSPKRSITQAMELAQKAISIDEFFGKARGLLGFLYTMTGQHEKGIVEAEKAVALDPNSDTALNYLGLALRFGGRLNEAIPVIKKAIRLNPFAPSAYLYNLGLCYVLTGQFEEAIAECKKATICEPDNLLAQVALTTVYGLSGRYEEARATASEVLRIDPKFSLENYSKTLPYKNQADRHRVIDALRKAGLK
jgi:adenylate cyclase